MTEYRLERLVDENAERWEGLNNSSPEGSLFHSLRWKEIVEKCSGVETLYFILYKDNDVVGLFPFVRDKIRFFRGLAPARDPQRLHAVLKEPGDPRIMRNFIAELRKVRIDGKPISFASVATFHQAALNAIPGHSSPLDEGLGEMVLDFSRLPSEEIWNGLSSKRRKKMRGVDRDGFSITEARSQDELEVFYRYYQENVRYVGGTPQPFSRFVDLVGSLSDEIRITMLTRGSLVAGGLFLLKDTRRKIVHGTYLSLNRDLPNRYSPSYTLWWEALTWAEENRFERFSFGAQHLEPENPRFRVKHDMGAQFMPIHSRIIPLSPSFSLGSRAMQYFHRVRADPQPRGSAS